MSTQNKKMGRPVIGERKSNDLKVRLDDTTYFLLVKYCEEHNITKAEAVRQAIQFMLEK